MMVDGRRAVAIAVVFLAAGLAPTAATFGGAPGAPVLGGGAVAAVLLAWVGWMGGRVLPWLSGLNPTIPAFAPADRLFGPRSSTGIRSRRRHSGRLVGELQRPGRADRRPFGGLLFPIAYAWSCGVIRLLLARTVEDLAVGVAMIGIASATAWLLRSGSDSLPGAVLACVAAPLAAFLAGWLNGRSSRRPGRIIEADAA